MTLSQTQTPKIKTRYVRKILGTLIVVSVIFGYVMYASNEFLHAYATYARLSKANVEAAYMPGAEQNPIRQHLNTILSQVLARPMSAKERLSFAREGLAVLKEGETQIDTIGDSGDKVQLSITYMEAKSKAPGALFLRSESDRILTLAKQELNINADIRGLSYRANFHTAEILNRIVLDQGELTAAYSEELDRQLPAVEEQFNKRTNLYKQLEAVNNLMQEESARLSNTWWLIGGGESSYTENSL